MLDGIQANAKGAALRTHAMDVVDAGAHFGREFDRIIGFFTLHHMYDVKGCFRGLVQVAKPGAVIAFCEPIAYNPLYYLQIAFTKNMTWEAEKGILNMRKAYVLPAMEEAGLVDLQCVPYGFFPPFIANTGWGRKIENAMEKARIFRWAHAFQAFVGRVKA